MDAKRDLYADGLPDYVYIRGALADAVRDVLDRDFDLLALGAHEQAIAHRIAVYLEPRFADYHVDCEYNRQKHKSKNRPAETESAQPRRMRPDIIVHTRNTSRNVLAVEMKANANTEKRTDDLAKLKELKGGATYLYKGTAFVRIYNGLGEMEDGCIRAIINWYVVDKDGIREEEGNRQKVSCSERIAAEVERFLRQRRR